MLCVVPLKDADLNEGIDEAACKILQSAKPYNPTTSFPTLAFLTSVVGAAYLGSQSDSDTEWLAIAAAGSLKWFLQDQSHCKTEGIACLIGRHKHTELSQNTFRARRNMQRLPITGSSHQLPAGQQGPARAHSADSAGLIK